MTFADSAALGRWLRKRAENVAVALLSTMFACFIIQIFFRYVLNNPVGWTEEVIVTSWLWTVLWGAAFIIGEAEEVRFDILYSNISENARRVCTVLAGCVQVRELHEGGAVGLSACADQPDVFGLHHLRGGLHRPLHMAHLSGHSR